MSSTITGTVTSSVTITGTGSYTSPLTIATGGTVSVGGTYTAVSAAISATVVDFGTVEATGSGGGIELSAGGYVEVGATTALVEAASYGIMIVGGAGTVTNAGTIDGAGTSGIGLELQSGGTVVDSGTIIGGATAIYFGTVGSDALELDPGYSLSGSIVVEGTTGNSLELLSGAGVGTISGLGSRFANFQTIAVAAGASWSLSGSNTLDANVTFDNAGSILSGELYLAGGNYVSNAGTGLIENADADALYIEGAGVTIVNAATIEATGLEGDGVYSNAGGYVDNSGSASLIEGSNDGVDLDGTTSTVTNEGRIEGATGVRIDSFPAIGTVINSGTITGTDGDGVEFDFYGHVDNETGGQISGSNAGIEGLNRAVTVVNQGSITATNAGGVQLFQGGYVSNASGGYIEGGHDGVYIGGASGTVTDFGTIVANGGSGFAGVRLAAGGTVIDGGTIEGAATAIYLGGSGTNLLELDPGYTISGSVVAGSGATNLLELESAGVGGTISGLGSKFTGFQTITVDSGARWTLAGGNTLDAGVSFDDFGSVIVENLTNATSILGAEPTVAPGGYLSNAGTGIIANNAPGAIAVYGTGGPATVVNAGTIEATGVGGIAIDLKSGGSIGNSSSILGGKIAVDVHGGAGTVTNSGSLIGTSTNGIALYDGGFISNSAAGFIEGFNGVGVAVVSGTLDNAGTIIGTGRQGAGLGHGGSVYNSGFIEGLSAGVYIGGGAGTVTNSGTIEATGAGTADDAVTLSSGGYVDNSGGAALIYGHAAAVYIKGGAGTVVNVGTIEGAGAGVDVHGAAGTVVNSGTIEATAAGNGNGVALYDGGTISNTSSGYIRGYNGAGVAAAYGLVNNAGTIIGTGRQGIGLGHGGNVYNKGLVEGVAFGVYITGGVGTVTNAGTVEATATSGTGIDLTAGGTVVDSGTIAGPTAIFMGGAGNNVVELAPGYALTGSIVVQGTADRLELLSAASQGTISGLATSFANFATVTVETGARWTLGSGDTIGADMSLDNLGTVSGELFVGAGGHVSNAATGLLENTNANPVYIDGAGASIVNAGTVEAKGASGTGIGSRDGGYILNSGTASLIEGVFSAVYVSGAAATVTNQGTIEGSALGAAGIFLKSGGTIVDSGRISGTQAVYLGGAGSNLLELETGYSISGSIVGHSGAANTLELSGALGAVSVTYNSLGLQHFGFVDFAAPTGGNDETLVIANTASLPGTIEGFTAAFHDIIDLTNFTYHSGATATEGANDRLTIVSGSSTLSLQLAGSYGIEWHVTADGHGGTDIEPACFVRGTLILTENGEVAVEDLSIGDRVVTYSGRVRPIRWIGRRSYKGAFLQRNPGMWPILVEAGALGPDAPRRDLYLSAKHALFLDGPLPNPAPQAAEVAGGGGLLIPVECLVNGRSIRRCGCPDEVEYFHIELETHDVIIAEGAAAETFVDCDDRGIFHNASEFALIYPGAEPPRWAFCTRRVEAGRELDAVRRRLLARAEALRPAA